MKKLNIWKFNNPIYLLPGHPWARYISRKNFWKFLKIKNECDLTREFCDENHPVAEKKTPT